MAQNLTVPMQMGSTLSLDLMQLHIIALTMEHKSSFIHTFLAEISILNGPLIVKQYKSKKEQVKKGKLQWRFNVSVPIAYEIVFKISKHHTFQSNEVFTVVSIPFTEILKFFKVNAQDSMSFQGPKGERLCLKIEFTSIQNLLKTIVLPSAILEKLGPAKQPIELLLGLSDQLGSVNSIAKMALGLFSKVYEQLEKQELCTQQLTILVDQIRLLSPLVAKAQELEMFESLQEVIQDILHLIQEVLEAIYKYNNVDFGFLGQLCDQYRSKPNLDVQKLSIRFKHLYNALNTSLQVDWAHNWKKAQIEVQLEKLRPHYKRAAAFCAENTCLDILETLDIWSRVKSEKLFWLHGIAGMGKSTIAATFSTKLEAQNLLGGYHICSRDGTIYQSPIQLVHNLCYQLSLAYKPFGTQVAKIIAKSFLFSSTGLSIPMLFKLLFLDPLRLVHFQPALGFIFIVDALDECGNSE
ncbi:hypothetical protein BDN72DRAFT_806308, partial [Pluteus cervinus]